MGCNNPNSLNKGSWRILKDFYCSVTMLRELGLTDDGIDWFIKIRTARICQLFASCSPAVLCDAHFNQSEWRRLASHAWLMYFVSYVPKMWICPFLFGFIQQIFFFFFTFLKWNRYGHLWMGITVWRLVFTQITGDKDRALGLVLIGSNHAQTWLFTCSKDHTTKLLFP